MAKEKKKSRRNTKNIVQMFQEQVEANNNETSESENSVEQPKKSSSNKQLLFELETLARDLGITVRYEKMETSGGICVFKGNQTVFMNKKADDEYKIEVMIESLRKVELGNHFVSPKVREILESY